MLFRVYTAFRGAFRPGKLTRNILDALAALGVIALTGYVMLAANWGELRLYVPVAMATGFLTCSVLVGDLVYHGAFRLFSRTRRDLMWVNQRTLLPARSRISALVTRIKQSLIPPPEPPQDGAPHDDTRSTTG